MLAISELLRVCWNNLVRQKKLLQFDQVFIGFFTY